MEFYYDEIDGDLLVLTADGGLNSDTAEEFVESIEKLVDAGLTRLIVDCAKLEHISSYGLGVLIRLHKRLQERGGDVKICNVRGIVPQILRATRLDGLLDMYPDVGRARLAFRPEGDS
jgi:stage II sporulation protein AA (anti-sigma F factor antagonist)